LNRVNHLGGMEEFLKQWDGEQSARPGALAPLCTSIWGHINLEGTPSCIEAAIFVKSHPQFDSALEPGVKQLVHELISLFDCVTYTSCQGHISAVDHSVTEADSVKPRHVGILPRNEAEHQQLFHLLSTAATHVNERMSVRSVWVAVRDQILTSEESDVSCIDVVFADASRDAEDYFVHVDGVYQEFIAALGSFSH
jgi:hypothetical protein